MTPLRHADIDNALPASGPQLASRVKTNALLKRMAFHALQAAAAVERSVQERLGDVVSIKDFGAKGEFTRATDISTTASSTTVTAAADRWTQADVGKGIVIEGADSHNGTTLFRRLRQRSSRAPDVYRPEHGQILMGHDGSQGAVGSTELEDPSSLAQRNGTTRRARGLDRVTLTETPQAGDHLVLGCGLLDFGALTTHQTDTQLLQGAVEIAHCAGRRTGDTNIPIPVVRARHPRSDRR